MQVEQLHVFRKSPWEMYKMEGASHNVMQHYSAYIIISRTSPRTALLSVVSKTLYMAFGGRVGQPQNYPNLIY